MLPARKSSLYSAVKPTVDRIITGILMLVALPLMLMVSVAILLLDGRPVFYRQTRVGKNGRQFRIWKFRTMCRNAEDATGVVWSSASDPRVTALGRWLRCSHLDELPQFFNVLFGDMNLIGPRPERPEFVRELACELPCYRKRLDVRPGITGLAQLHLGYDQSLADVQRKVLLDLEYIRTMSALQDAKILLMTIPYIANQLICRWKTDARRLDNTKDNTKHPGAIHSVENGVATRVRRRKLESSRELNPHIAHLPNTSIGSFASGVGAHFSPRFFTMDDMARATDDCQ